MLTICAKALQPYSIFWYISVCEAGRQTHTHTHILTKNCNEQIKWYTDKNAHIIHIISPTHRITSNEMIRLLYVTLTYPFHLLLSLIRSLPLSLYLSIWVCVFFVVSFFSQSFTIEWKHFPSYIII